MSKIVRYGLISTADIGFSAHLPASKTSPSSEIVAVSSRNIESAQAAAEKHNIALAFGSYQEMIDSVMCDLDGSANKGWEAALAAIEMVHVLRSVGAGEA